MKGRANHFFAFLALSAAIASGCAAGRVAGSYDDRTWAIAAKLAEADRLGARDCSPRQLAHARVRLDRVRHEMAEPHYPPMWLHWEVERVDALAGELLENRRLAAKFGGGRFTCVGSAR